MPYKMTFDKDKLDNIIRRGGSNHLNEYAEESQWNWRTNFEQELSNLLHDSTNIIDYNANLK
jgi:hypothetical protein